MLTTFTIYLYSEEDGDCYIAYQIKRCTPFFLRPGDSVTLIDACGFSVEVEHSTYNVDDDTVYVDLLQKVVKSKKLLLENHACLIDSAWTVLECSPDIVSDIE